MLRRKQIGRFGQQQANPMAMASAGGVGVQCVAPTTNIINMDVSKDKPVDKEDANMLKKDNANTNEIGQPSTLQHKHHGKVMSFICVDEVKKVDSSTISALISTKESEPHYL
jgi:hypothetical protein